MKNRNLNIDLLKIIACFSVIILHTISTGLKEAEYINGLWLYYIGVFAIPIFFMVNGYLQSDKKNDYKYVIKKIIKILVIVISWASFLYMIKIILNKEVDNYIFEVFGCLIQKGEFSHFWFLGTIIIIDLFLPLIQKLYKSSNYEILLLILFIICIISDIIFIVLYRKNGFIYKDNIIQTFRIWTWFFYFMLGGFIKKHEFNLKKFNFKIEIISMILIFLATLLYQIIFSKILYGNMYAENFYNSIFVICTSFLIFIVVLRLSLNSNLIAQISQLTFGVYIIHYNILGIINKILIVDNNYFNVIKAVIVSIISIIISFSISKIPKVKELIKI